MMSSYSSSVGLLVIASAPYYKKKTANIMSTKPSRPLAYMMEPAADTSPSVQSALTVEKSSAYRIPKHAPAAISAGIDARKAP